MRKELNFTKVRLVKRIFENVKTYIYITEGNIYAVLKDDNITAYIKVGNVDTMEEATYKIDPLDTSYISYNLVTERLTKEENNIVIEDVENIGWIKLSMKDINNINRITREKGVILLQETNSIPNLIGGFADNEIEAIEAINVKVKGCLKLKNTYKIASKCFNKIFELFKMRKINLKANDKIIRFQDDEILIDIKSIEMPRLNKFYQDAFCIGFKDKISSNYMFLSDKYTTIKNTCDYLRNNGKYIKYPMIEVTSDFSDIKLCTDKNKMKSNFYYIHLDKSEKFMNLEMSQYCLFSSNRESIKIEDGNTEVVIRLIKNER